MVSCSDKVRIGEVSQTDGVLGRPGDHIVEPSFSVQGMTQKAVEHCDFGRNFHEISKEQIRPKTQLIKVFPNRWGGVMPDEQRTIAPR